MTPFLIGKRTTPSAISERTYFNTPDAKEVVLKARGRAITTAVDVAEITRRRFMEKIKIDKINIGTEELTEQDGRTRAVSTIEITLLL
jgi:DNA-binding protein